MKRFWSRFILVATLVCLIAVWAIPALAYYPPVELKITKKGNHEVIYHAKDPEDNNNYGSTEQFVTELTKADGIMAMVRKPPIGDVQYRYVTFAIYDPYRKEIKKENQGPYVNLSPLQVADGVVAYIAEDPEGKKAFFYATYEPREGMWRTQKQVVNTLPEALYSNLEMTTADGVVAYRFIIFPDPIKFPDRGLNMLYGDIYNPLKANWQTAIDGLPTSIATINHPQDILTYSIEHATILWTWGNIAAKVSFSEQKGYYCSPVDGTGIWQTGGPTRAMAYFVPQLPTGPGPLWVWFTDMSIGADSVEWLFGDGAEEKNKRSTYHNYTRQGTFMAYQGIKALQVELPHHIRYWYGEEIKVGQ